MGDGRSMRLHVPGDDEQGEYLALNYCWGDSQPFITKIQNLKTMKSGFPVSAFPMTFRDAVQVTRSLGIRFLWIDALCIMQDSSGDKS